MTMALISGLGIFLLGMILLTDGLKSLAGEALRRILTRAVRGPVSGVGWGALVTALVQSSTATTLTTIGFVSAGLLTFTQSVGVIFGANLGTTSTGWIVSQLGFKVSLGSYAPPLVLLGVFMRLIFKSRLSHAGTALVGFGLLFIGIDLLQDGMGGLAERITPDDLPGAALNSLILSRLILVGVGFIMTVVMFSSSAAMATTLAAVATGTIGLDQAAALIIGQNIGTTPKAIAAALGGSSAAKRTALAHVLFNFCAGAIAFTLLSPLIAFVQWFGSLVNATDTPTLLALFHTIFNVLGVALLLPLIHPFSRIIERIIPEKTTSATRFLDPSVTEVGPVALEAAYRSMAQVLTESAAHTRTLLNRPRTEPKILASLKKSTEDIDTIRKFIHSLSHSARAEAEIARSAALLHGADHTQRLLGNLADPPRNASLWQSDPVIAPTMASIIHAIQPLLDPLQVPDGQTRSVAIPQLFDTIQHELEQTSRRIAQQRKEERAQALQQAASGTIEPDAAVARIEAMLWLDGIAYHLWRAAHKLAIAHPLTAKQSLDATQTEQSEPAKVEISAH